MAEYKKILIIRADRLGDCILSTGAVDLVKKAFPKAVVDVLTTPYTREVFEGNPSVGEVIVDDPNAAPILSSKFFAFAGAIKRRGYDICYILHITFRSALIPFLAGIPVRVAPASKIYQFLANYRVKQKRSKCEMNEAEYNIDLIARHLGIERTPSPSRIFVQNGAAEKMLAFLDAAIRRSSSAAVTPSNSPSKNPAEGGSLVPSSFGRRLVAVHPGSGGSALNMSPARYAELIEKLHAAGHTVFLSTGPAEDALRDDIFSRLSFRPPFFDQAALGRRPTLGETFALLSLCDAVVAPSTGIMHAAVALGRPVVTVFCPIFVCVPKRWGPDPAATARAEVIMPAVKCSDPSNITMERYCEKCIGGACRHYNCMDGVSIDGLFAAVERVMGEE